MRDGTTVARCLTLALLIGCGAASCGTGRDVGTTVTRSRIESIQVGMTQHQVEQLLGHPRSTEQASDGTVVLSYAKRPPGVRWYPMLWVHIKDGKTTEVYAKRCGFVWWDEEVGVYRMSRSGTWKSPEFDSLFP